jgi:O-antigen/teichoic acid export membrane protein
VTESAQKLGRRIVRGGVWTATRHGAHQVFALVQVVFVARLLPPDQVGLLSMATLVITTTQKLTETGFDKALVQRGELDEETLRVAWSVMLLRYALLGLLMASGAGVFALFFDEPGIIPLLRVLAVALALEGLISIRVVVFQRELDFRRHFIFQMAGEVVGLGVTIALAYATHSIWSVVYGQIASAVARVIGSYALDPKRPHFLLRRAPAMELMRYGRWVSASTALMLAISQGDNMFVGRVLGATELAYYAWAFQLSNMPGLSISQVLGQVMFPAYATVQNDLPRLSDLFTRSLRLAIALAFPASALIAALCPLFVHAVLGDKWLPIVPIVLALSGFGAMRALGTTGDAFLLAIGRPEVRTKIQIAQLVILAAAIVPLSSRYGTVGVGWAVALYGLLNVYEAALCVQLCGLPQSVLWKPAAQVVGASAGAVAIALLAARGLAGLPAPLALLAASLAACVAYALCLFGLDRFMHQGSRVAARGLLWVLCGRAPARS